MTDPGIDDKTPYPQRTGAALPLAVVRKAIVEWVIPFNNMALLTTNVLLSGLVGSLADFAKARWSVLPWLLGLSLFLLATCLVLQSYAVPRLSAWVARGRLSVLMRRTLPMPLLLLVLVTAVFAAYGRNKPRGVLATAAPTLQSLQDTLFGIQAGIDSANHKLDVLLAADAARNAAIAAQPASLAVVDLAVAGAQADGIDLRATILLNAKNLAPGKTSFRVKVTSADGQSRVLDLSAALAAAGDGDAQLALKVPGSARQLTTCLGAPYPDAAQPHALLSSYAFDPTNGGALAQKGKTTMVPATESPCAS